MPTRVRAAREAAGPDFALMVDANQGYDRAAGGRVRTARRGPRHPLVRGALPLDQRPPLDARRALPDGHPGRAPARARRRCAGIRDLIVDGAIDVSNFDASWAGGPTIWRKAAGLCAAFGVELGHHEEPQVAAHLLASVPDHTFVECFDEERDPFFWRLSDMSTRIRDGRYTCPNGPASGSSSTGSTSTRTRSTGESRIGAGASGLRGRSPCNARVTLDASLAERSASASVVAVLAVA